MEQGELALGRRLVGQREFDQRLEEHRFVGAAGIEARAARRPCPAIFSASSASSRTRAIAERQLQRVLRHAIAQRIALGHA